MSRPVDVPVDEPPSDLPTKTAPTTTATTAIEVIILRVFIMALLGHLYLRQFQSGTGQGRVH